MLIRPSEDAINVFLRKDPRTSKSGRSHEDFRRFLRHEHGSFYRIRRSPEGDDAMIFEQNYGRRETQLFDADAGPQQTISSGKSFIAAKSCARDEQRIWFIWMA